MSTQVQSVNAIKPPTAEQAQIAAMQARIAELEAMQHRPMDKLNFKIGEKGGVSVVGLGRFPTTLYYEQWIRLLNQADELKSYLEANKAKLSMKAPRS